MLAPPMALIGCFLLFLVRVSSVESVMGVAAAGGTFSMLLTGTLYLQVGQHHRVALHRNTPHRTAQPGVYRELIHQEIEMDDVQSPPPNHVTLSDHLDSLITT